MDIINFSNITNVTSFNWLTSSNTDWIPSTEWSEEKKKIFLILYTNCSQSFYLFI